MLFHISHYILLLWTSHILAQSEHKRVVEIQKDTITVTLTSLDKGLSKFVVDIGFLFGVSAQNCSQGDVYCLEWNSDTKFQISQIDKFCNRVQFKTFRNIPLICKFNLSGIHIYGGPETGMQTWPAEKSSLNMPYITDADREAHSVLESYWLSSAGQYVYVNKSVPLFVNLIPESQLEFRAELQPPYFRNNHLTNLDFLACASFPDAKIAHMDAVRRVLGKPAVAPSYHMTKYPIWSTWATFKQLISQEALISFANTMFQNGFRNIQFEIDDKWESCYGSFEVDTVKFPNFKKLVKFLKSYQFRVTMWIHPFININCEPYFEFAHKSGFLVKGRDGQVITKWWDGTGACIDFTNPGAAKWWSQRLEKLRKDTGIDSYKFDAGEYNWFPTSPAFPNASSDWEVNLKSYIHTVSHFGNAIEVRCGRETQQYGIFVRMMDRDTKWTSSLGLSTLIPTLLLMNIIGYPFVLPDMVGGNGYGSDVLTEEMFIRWLQINVFMPSLQFSMAPWLFGNKTVNITKKYVTLHEQYADTIYSLMVQCTQTGVPVNLPLWWLDPHDEASQTIDSEFLLGENILVAPVLKEGAQKRDIYFPCGFWLDHNSGNIIEGPKWVYNYDADLETLPYFSRQHT